METISKNWSEAKHEKFFRLLIKNFVLYIIGLFFFLFYYSHSVKSMQETVAAFEDGKNILCDKFLLSKKSNWKYNEAKGIFFNNERVFYLDFCEATTIQE